MALTFGAIGSQGTRTPTGTSILVPYPSGITAGMTLVLVVYTSDSTLLVNGTAIPSGWTQAISARGTGSQSPVVWVGAKIATGSESGNLTVTLPVTATAHGWILRFAGGDGTNILDVAGSSVSPASTTSYTIPAITTTMVGTGIITGGVSFGPGGTWSPATNGTLGTLTEDADTTDAVTPQGSVDHTIWSGSGTTSSVTKARSSSLRSVAWMIALRPASGATVSATAAGTQAGTGSAVATATTPATVVHATAGATQGGTGAVTAVVRHPATAGASQASTAAAIAKRTVRGVTAVGTQAGVGTAVAKRTVRGVTAIGTQAGTGAAAATRSTPAATVHATAAGTQAGLGAVAAKVRHPATAAGTQAGTGAAIAKRTVRGVTAVGTQAGVGTVAAKVKHPATAAGTQAGTGTAAATVTAGSWSPASLTGLVAWFDANDPASFTYSSGSVVSQWADKSGGARHLTQATVPSQPSRTGSRNGKPSVVFNGGYLRYAGTTGLNVGNVTAFVVAGESAAVSNAGILSVHNSTGTDFDNQNAFLMDTRSGAVAMQVNRYYLGTSGGSGFATATGPKPSPFAVYGAVLRNDGTLDAYRSGVVGSSTARAGTFGVAAGGYLMAARWTSSAVLATPRFLGDVAEVVVYDRVLTDVERGQVETYLAGKWITTVHATAAGTGAGTGTAVAKVRHPATAAASGSGGGVAVARVKHPGTAYAAGSGAGGVVALKTVHAYAAGGQAGSAVAEATAAAFEHPYGRVKLPDPGSAVPLAAAGVRVPVDPAGNRVPIDVAETRVPVDPGEARTPTIA